MRFDLTSATRNPINLIGPAIATAAAVVVLLSLALEFGGQIQTPYLSLLFIAVPVVFVSALVLVPIAVWRQHRRIAQQKAIDEWPVIDLRLPRWDRCHTDTLKMEDGRTISQDCESCHARP